MNNTFLPLRGKKRKQDKYNISNYQSVKMPFEKTQVLLNTGKIILASEP